MLHKQPSFGGTPPARSRALTGGSSAQLPPPRPTLSDTRKLDKQHEREEEKAKKKEMKLRKSGKNSPITTSISGLKLSINDVLHNPELRESFHAFLEKEYAAESILFWAETEAFSAKANTGASDVSLRDDACYIYNKFIRNSSSDSQVNLAATISEEIRAALYDHPGEPIKPTLFSSAQMEILQLMQGDCFPRWAQQRSPDIPSNSSPSQQKLLVEEQERTPTLDITLRNPTLAKHFQEYMQAIGHMGIYRFFYEAQDLMNSSYTKEAISNIIGKYTSDKFEIRITFPSSLSQELKDTTDIAVVMKARDWCQKQVTRYHQLWVLTKEWKQLVNPETFWDNPSSVPVNSSPCLTYVAPPAGAPPSLTEIPPPAGTPPTQPSPPRQGSFQPFQPIPDYPLPVRPQLPVPVRPASSKTPDEAKQTETKPLYEAELSGLQEILSNSARWRQFRAFVETKNIDDSVHLDWCHRYHLLTELLGDTLSFTEFILRVCELIKSLWPNINGAPDYIKDADMWTSPAITDLVDPMTIAGALQATMNKALGILEKKYYADFISQQPQPLPPVI